MDFRYPFNSLLNCGGNFGFAAMPVREICVNQYCVVVQSTAIDATSVPAVYQ